MQLTILGRPISKKNSRIALRNGMNIPSKAYRAFEKLALDQLGSRYELLRGQVVARYTFYMKGKLDADCDNMIAGINDILQKAGIIEDDCYIVAGTFEKVAGHGDWKTVIDLESLASDGMTVQSPELLKKSTEEEEEDDKPNKAKNNKATNVHGL